MSTWGIAAAALLLAGVPAVATTPAQQASPKKQLSACMTQQMSSNRRISYHEAMKGCKALLKSRAEDALANNAKPAGAR